MATDAAGGEHAERIMTMLRYAVLVFVLLLTVATASAAKRVPARYGLSAEQLVWYCAGQAGVSSDPKDATLSRDQMIWILACVEQYKTQITR
jgi:hypothetical protein